MTCSRRAGLPAVAQLGDQGHVPTRCHAEQDPSSRRFALGARPLGDGMYGARAVTGGVQVTTAASSPDARRHGILQMISGVSAVSHCRCPLRKVCGPLRIGGMRAAGEPYECEGRRGRRVRVAAGRDRAGGAGAGQGHLAGDVRPGGRGEAAGADRGRGRPVGRRLPPWSAGARPGRPRAGRRAGLPQHGPLRAADRAAGRRRRVGDPGQLAGELVRAPSPGSVGLPRRGLPRRRARVTDAHQAARRRLVVAPQARPGRGLQDAQLDDGARVHIVHGDIAGAGTCW